ncbi:MAG: hypothetical protein ACI83P_001936 [Janthinobacterium sp.]|jgi:hypothetical protein
MNGQRTDRESTREQTGAGPACRPIVFLIDYGVASGRVCFIRACSMH